MTTVDAPERTRDFCVSWSLDECRAQTQREPALHQAQVLEDLTRWYENNGRKGGAGILVLPTGGGKTFTAVRFLCAGPLSEGKKVLWLAHTHHLLEQAFGAVKREVMRRDGNACLCCGIEILPKYRGLRIGLAVMRHMSTRFSSGAGLVAIKPFPLQFELHREDDEWRAELELEKLPGNEQIARQRLCDDYRTLGFVPVEGTPFLVTSTTRALPCSNSVRA